MSDSFWGLALIAVVLFFGLRRLSKSVAALVFVIERALNLNAVRNGQPPITTPEDEKLFR